eukprot:NODE_17484_length_178_cov_1.108527_g16869_i0.p3 GENE.NODE_17484_length_178_cov_1.108527_g16869_i0~~NODE_17484_length_178_cov_1.108527_g16869_i0.p3  ORF type:complete len:51 (-),score=7.11 NODE_17484_length_178_cov_1.108527_g16869_i0:25-177(-)
MLSIWSQGHLGSGHFAPCAKCPLPWGILTQANGKYMPESWNVIKEKDMCG